MKTFIVSLLLMVVMAAAVPTDSVSGPVALESKMSDSSLNTVDAEPSDGRQMNSHHHHIHRQGSLRQWSTGLGPGTAVAITSMVIILYVIFLVVYYIFITPGETVKQPYPGRPSRFLDVMDPYDNMEWNDLHSRVLRQVDTAANKYE